MALTHDAITVLRELLGLGLAEAARLTAIMADHELDLVEREKSAVAVAALVYHAQLRAARRIADPERQRQAIRAARTDANRHDAIIRDRVPLDPHAADRVPRPQATPVYSLPLEPPGGWDG